MTLIDWGAFTWEAFATLATGLAAVAGAVWVGSRQMNIAYAQTRISLKQTAILDRQNRLEESKLRAELFDRRMLVYEATADFLINLRDIRGQSAGVAERLQTFSQKMRESEFLFAPKVHRGLVEIWEAGNQLRADRETLALTVLSLKEGEDWAAQPQLVKRIEDAQSWSRWRLDTLAHLFRDDLQILKPRTGTELVEDILAKI